MWVATPELPRTAGHPFYARLNHILHKHDFNEYVELCEQFYADEVGRPGLPPGRDFRLLLIAISRVRTPSAPSRGGRPIRLPCAIFSAWRCPRRRPCLTVNSLNPSIAAAGLEAASSARCSESIRFCRIT